MHLSDFKNEPVINFKKARDSFECMQAALEQVRGELGREYPLVIGGERVQTPEKFQSINPSCPEQVIGTFSKGSASHARQAVQAAEKAFEAWSRTPVETRAELLVNTARLLREKKFYFDAWMVYEVGKTWPEADADISEAIDFCEYYAREMLRIGKPQPLLPVEGERSFLRYIPLGVGAVIPPWNFPSALLTGMTAASIVAGNTAVLKPSCDSSTIAYKFFEVLEQAGMPAGVVNFLSGAGSVAGEELVTHPRTRFIAFTGSKEVGLRINQVAAKPAPGQIWIKRVVAEMGGKNSIVVDSESNLDAAVEGVTVSAFGYQGQKCSACSRAIVVENVYDKFLAKLKVRVSKIKVGDPAQPGTDMGPVVNANAKKTILEYIDVGQREGRLVTGGKTSSSPGYFIEPTVIADVPPQARIAQEEIFGPVLAVLKAPDFEEALQIADNTEFGLTGAVYTENRTHLEAAAERFHVGNLYFNRKCTGALVGSHPFGGFNMSGTDSKAGGSDYLLLFTQAKTIAEKIG